MTTDIYSFVDNHPLISLFIIWGMFALVFRIVMRSCRVIAILFRGWPPAHLDADGNWKPVKKEGGE